MPEARDEGPRLLPLEKEPAPESRLNYYLELADLSLKPKTEKTQPRTSGVSAQTGAHSKPGRGRSKARSR
jgi:hypothetical protein